MTNDDELQLFAEQAAWIAPRLPDPTRRGLICWLGTHLSQGAGQRIARLLPLDHAVHLRAEEAIVELLERRVLKTHRQLLANDAIARDVDWPVTLERAAGMTPTVYFERRPIQIPDRPCVGALAALARSWLAMLELGEGEHHRRREERLRRTLRRVGPVTGAPGFSHRVGRSLSQLDAAAAERVNHIRAALRFWSERFDASDAVSLVRIGQKLRSDSINNPDNLLEVSATLSICRAACQLTESCVPNQIWEVHSRIGHGRTETVIKAGPLRCTIYKGKPSPRPEQEDRLNPSLRLMGLMVRGGQPDINLRFERDRCAGAVYLLGDAKRNWTGDGVNYLRTAVEAAAAYSLSYSHLLGMSRDSARSGAVRAIVHPAVTLFCRRSVRHVLGMESTADIVDQLRTAPELPPIMAFDLERHFGPGQHEWLSPILSAWFHRISSDANRALQEGRGIA